MKHCDVCQLKTWLGFMPDQLCGLWQKPYIHSVEYSGLTFFALTSWLVQFSCFLLPRVLHQIRCADHQPTPGVTRYAFHLRFCQEKSPFSTISKPIKLEWNIQLESKETIVTGENMCIVMHFEDVQGKLACMHHRRSKYFVYHHSYKLSWRKRTSQRSNSNKAQQNIIGSSDSIEVLFNRKFLL